MPCLPLLEYPDPRLRQHSAPVQAFDDGLQILIDNLFDTLYATGGIGLSAPQIGDFRRVMVMDLSGDGSAPQLYINPEIITAAVQGLAEESCLSVPGVVGNVVRATRLQVRARDRQGEVFERTLDGMHAVCMQHEIDHLDGKLFIDRLSLFRRLRLHLASRARRRELAQATPAA